MQPQQRISIHAQNLRALQRVQWSPQGVCALVGANGSGKTTLLLTLKLLRAALDDDLPSAVTAVLGGSYGLAQWGHENQPIEVGLDVGDLQWRIRLIPEGSTVASRTEETLTLGNERIIESNIFGHSTFRGEALPVDGRIALSRALSIYPKDGDIQKIASSIRSITVFHDFELWKLRGGSDATQDRHLHSRGLNAITMLRRWAQERPNRYRYEFVVNGLKSAFPDIVDDVDFQSAGRTLAAQFYAPRRDIPTPIATTANGVLALLVLLCALAGSENNGLVAIDEPETALHPYAIRIFLGLAKEWSRQHGLTVILATHSPALLDELTPEPGQVFVMKRGPESTPIPLNQLKNPNWLRGFRLGELQLTDELSSNAGDAH